jgi:hypothetical protein
MMYAWMVQAAAEAADAPIIEAKVRFRSALYPSQQATLETEVVDGEVKMALMHGATQLVTGIASVATDTE